MIIPPVRPQDDYGSGEYRARRGGRLHQGVDFAAYPDSVALSDVNGVIHRLGYPYSTKGLKGEYRLIEIIDENDAFIKYMYIEPLLTEGTVVKKGNAIGIVQDLSKLYPRNEEHPNGMINHYHVEVWVNDYSHNGFTVKKNINPKKYFEHGVIEDF